MIRLAICDDMPLQLSTLLKLTEEYLKANNIFAEVITFSHPDKLLSACSCLRFNLYILDIVMPMMSGIDVGREIRRVDKEAQIVFATSESSFALQSFVANPINYLIKPIKKAEFFATLSLCFSKMKDEDSITIKTKNGLITIPKYKIEFCEFVGRAVQYNLLGGEKHTTMSSTQNFSEQVESLLECNYFIKPHASYIINLRHVEKLNKEEFVLHSGNIVPECNTLKFATFTLTLDYGGNNKLEISWQKKKGTGRTNLCNFGARLAVIKICPSFPKQ